MKNILLSGLLIAYFVSGCSSDNQQQDPLVVKMDSIANARVNAKSYELAKKNDSILKAMELLKADSIEQAVKKEDSLKRFAAAHKPKDTVTRSYYTPPKQPVKDTAKGH